MFLGGPELMVIGLLSIVAMIYGSLEGRRSGHQGTPLGLTCLRALGRSFIATSMAAFLVFVLMAVLGFMGPSGTEAFAILFPAIILSPILGILSSLLPAPIAAFIAYNFGARKRAEEEIANQTLPPESAP